MRAICLIAFVLVLHSFVIAQKQSVVITSVKANLRGTPDIHGIIVTTADMGDTFAVIKQEGSWFLVQNAKYVGWVHGSTVKVVDKYQAPIAAIPSGMVLSPDIPGKYVLEPEKVPIGTLQSDKDDGYDIGYVTLDGVYLREMPNKTSSVVKTLHAGDLVVLLARSKSYNWLNVFDVDSGKEGWVYLSHLRVYLTSAPKSSVPSFQASRVDSEHEPIITVRNDSDRTMTLRIGDQTYTIEPSRTRTVYLTGGTYKFFASASRTYPLYGDKNFSKGYDYDWAFYIVKKVVP